MAPPIGRFARFLRLFEHPRALAVIVALAVLLTLPTLQIGFYSDDFGQLAQIERTVPALSHSSPVDLYRFITADRAEFAGFVKYGPVPWFADPALKLHFFRPLSSLLMALDHALWGRHPLGYHVTCILLYAALVLAAGRFFRTLLGAPAAVTAMLATLCFAVQGGHFQPVGWIACRHLVAAALPAALGLAAHVRHVRDGWRPGAWLGPLGVAVALLGSEAGLGAVVYWLAHDALGPAPPRASSPRARLLASVPVLVIAAVYAVTYKALGFGAAGNGAYFDPVADPLGFTVALFTRVPALLAEAFVGAPSDLFMAMPAAPFVILGLLGTAAMVALYRLVRPAIPDDERAALRWLLPAALGSLLLAAGGFPGGRLLLFPSFGGAVLIAILLRRGTERLAELSRGGSRVGLGVGRGWLVVVHLVFGPLVFLGNAGSVAEIARGAEGVFRNAQFGPGRRRVAVIAASDPGVAFFPATVAAVLAPEMTGTWHVVSMAKHDHRLTRTGPGSFRLEVIGGRMMDSAFEKVFRSPRTPFHVGDRKELSGLTITVVAVAGDVPTALEAAFDVPLDDPALDLLAWRDGRLTRFAPPEVGASVVLSWSPGPHRLF